MGACCDTANGWMPLPLLQDEEGGDERESMTDKEILTVQVSVGKYTIYSEETVVVITYRPMPPVGAGAGVDDFYIYPIFTVNNDELKDILTELMETPHLPVATRNGSIEFSIKQNTILQPEIHIKLCGVEIPGFPRGTLLIQQGDKFTRFLGFVQSITMLDMTQWEHNVCANLRGSSVSK
jgi:hypothetical protein